MAVTLLTVELAAMAGEYIFAKRGNQMSKTHGDKIVMSPRDKARDLCAEIVWWHSALGSPVTVEAVFSRERARWAATVRGDCIRRLRHKLGWSFPRLGKFFGIDHSTCVHHVATRGVINAKTEMTRDGARRLMRAHREALLAENPQRWAVVPRQPKYSVSDNGLVRFDAKGNIRNPQVSTTGYAFITFASGPKGRPVFWAVHALVMEAFVGPRLPGMQVCHNDGNRLNNRLSNLRYGTAKDNAEDRDWHMMTRRGVENGNAKIKNQAVIDDIRRTYAAGAANQYELARMHGISQAQVNNIILNKQHKAAAGKVQQPQGEASHENP